MAKILNALNSLNANYVIILICILLRFLLIFLEKYPTPGVKIKNIDRVLKIKSLYVWINKRPTNTRLKK